LDLGVDNETVSNSVDSFVMNMGGAIIQTMYIDRIESESGKRNAPSYSS